MKKKRKTTMKPKNAHINWKPEFYLSLILLSTFALLLNSSVAEGQTPKMYWTSLRGIDRAETSGTSQETLLSVAVRNPHFMAIDASGGKIYWTDNFLAVIRRANLDGSGVEDLVTTGLTSPEGIALDVAGGKMYWTGSTTAKIQRANLDGTNVEDLVTTGLSNPQGIALDVAGGKMFWIDVGTAKIQQANLNGTFVEDLVTMGVDFAIRHRLRCGRREDVLDG